MLKSLAIAASAGAVTLTLGTAAQASTLFSSDIEVEQSTTPSPGFDGQSGQAVLALVEDDDGEFELTMTVNFFGALDFTGVESAFDEVEGDAQGGGDVVTGFHIHNAPRGVGGPIVFSIFDQLAGTPIEGPTDASDQSLTYNDDGSVTIESVWDLNEGTSDGILADFVGELLAAAEGQDVALYFNLHTATAGAGLIRGQIVGANGIGADAVPVPAAAFLFAPVIAGGIAARRKAKRA